MEFVNRVLIEIEYDPSRSNGALRVNFEAAEPIDQMIVFTMALHRDERLRILVKHSLEFLASDEFKEILKKHGH